jgi:signal transduction histidine kinase
MAETTDPGWRWSRLRAVDPWITDGLLAAFMLAIGVLTLAGAETVPDTPQEPDALGYLLTIVGSGALAFRRHHPIPAYAVSLVATMCFSLSEYPENGLPIATLIALYTVASIVPRMQAAIAAAAAAAVIMFLTAVGAQGLDAAGAVGNLAIFGTGYAFGSYMRVRRDYTEQLELRAKDLEENQRREAEQAVAEERLRIARELHDVVAHAMSVVAVQSGVAAHVIDQQPDEARTMLQNINATSREALDEMRRMLGVLRADGDDGQLELAPAPSLGDLRSLVSSIESTGVDVELSVDGDAPDLAPGLDLTAFRIVQEALTNVVKHAGQASVAVRVRYGADELAVVVEDDGRGAAAAPVDAVGGGGHGLVGMQERVDLFGGSLAAGPRAGGGFRVAATLPYRAGAAVS